MVELDTAQKRQAILSYVETMAEGTARSDTFSDIIQEVLSRGIANIPDHQIAEWYLLLFDSKITK